MVIGRIEVYSEVDMGGRDAKTLRRLTSFASLTRVLWGLNVLRAYELVMPCSRMMLPMRLLDAVTPFLPKAALIFLAP